MALQQHHRLPVAAVPYAQRHLADVDVFEREAFEPELLRPARRPREGRGRPRLTRCPIDPGSRPRADVDDGLAWPYDRLGNLGWCHAVGLGGRGRRSRFDADRCEVAVTRGSFTTGEADGVPAGGRAQLVLDVSGDERSSESGMQHLSLL
jgi:hypothetical protein